jgi:GTP:adenosylcobinamide-phosphate guanylyltransferase
MKYEMKKLKAKVKLIDVSASAPSVDSSALQEFREELAYANGAVDEVKQESSEAKDAASEAVQAVVPVGVSVSEGVDSNSIKKMFDASNMK